MALITAAGEQGNRTSDAARPKILVVEDESLLAAELEYHLQQAGFTVVGIASSAEEALEFATSEKPDLAVMDIRLAGPRDGIEAAIHLRSQLGIPSIFATGHADEATRKRGEVAQPLGWLDKPFSGSALVALVKKAITR
jgi:two-component system, response regulator PdtaR